jgi:hypothetical protein
MPDPNNVPKIVPLNAPIMGNNLTIVADADPEHFPHGLQLLIMAPGSLQPLGGGPIPPGHMLAIVPPEIAKMIRPGMRNAMQRQPGPGEVRAPGIH